MTRLDARLWPVIALAPLLLSACASLMHPGGPGPGGPRLEAAGPAPVFVASDGLRLPLRRYLPPDNRVRGVFLALHGFNDYSRAFDAPGRWFAARGFALYAYDQRGFGAGPSAGLWAGAGRLAEDARDAVGLLRGEHPGVPLHVLGESMGGAVALVATARVGLDADGLILVAPAVWAHSTQPWYQRLALSAASGLWPGGKISARFLGRQVSDNPATLAALENDPLVIKRVRFDTLRGLVDLMGEALASAPAIDAPVLMLYGAHDNIIPPEPVDLFWEQLPQAQRQVRRDYADGWHLLLRDLHAERVYEDILSFAGAGTGHSCPGRVRSATASC